MTQKAENKFIYYLENSMYINITNLCTNKCEFCIKSSGDSIGGVNLVLKQKNITAEEVIKELKSTFSSKCREIVFCGYGEPLIELDIVKKTAEFIKKNYDEIPVRINTNGHANLIHKRNIVPELVGLIDKISVSLNADTSDLYAKLCNPSFDKEAAYQGVKDFIKECVKNGIETTATVVSGFDNYEVDIEKCKKLAEEIGAKFRVREWLPVGYNQE